MFQSGPASASAAKRYVRQPKVLVMDIWKFYDITHREHVVCNPTSEDKLARLIGLLRLPAKARLVDIALWEG